MVQRLKSFFFFLFIFSVPLIVVGQKKLKSLAAYQHNKIVEVNWEFKDNAGPLIKRISVQRTNDSSTYFSTIGSVEKPKKKINTYTDNKPFPDSNFYRFFMLYEDGSYAFSKVVKAVKIPDIIPDAAQTSERKEGWTSDSDLLKDYFQPSLYIFTNEKGNVNIRLPNVKQNSYTIRFYDATDHFVFELKDIKKPLLIVDKANFLHGGWFHYKLYKNRHIFEQWKFFVPDMNL